MDVDTSRMDALAEAATMALDEMDYDSDTDIEARVSPEYPHPLHSGDRVEDEEMFARINFASEFAGDRSAFTSVLCDNM